MHVRGESIVQTESQIWDFAETFAKENVDRLENPFGRYDKSQMTIHREQILKSEEEARAYIQKHDTGFYSDHAVRFYKEKAPSGSKKIQDLTTQLEKTKKAEKNFIQKHSIHLRKADTISCPKCKSRIALAYMRQDKEKCPVCGHDLRPYSTLEKIKKFKVKERSLSQKIRKEKEKSKPQKSVLWLVKVEVHA